MLNNFFGKSSPINFVIIVGIFLIYFFSHYFVGFSQISINEIIILIALTLLIFFFYNFILFKNKLTLYNSYGFLIFVVLFGIISSTNFDRNIILFHGLLLVFLRRVYSLRTDKNISGKLFDSGFWLGIFFIFEPFSAVFGVLIYLSNGLFQKMNWQSLFIPVVGFFTTLFCAFAYYFWLDQTVIFWSYFDWYSSYDVSIYNQLSLKLPLYVIGIITFLTFIIKTPKVIGVSGDYRKYWILITVNLILTILFILLLRNKSGAEVQYLFFPISIIIANGIESINRKSIREVMLILALLMPILMLII